MVLLWGVVGNRIGMAVCGRIFRIGAGFWTTSFLTWLGSGCSAAMGRGGGIGL